MSGLLTLNDTRGLKDPAPSWRWVATMPTINASLHIPANFSPVISLPRGYITKVSLPVFDFETDNVIREGHAYAMPGDTQTLRVAMTSYEDGDYTASRYMKTWRYLVKHPNNEYGLPKDYKMTISCALHDIVDNKNPRLTAIMYGCWPITFSDIDLQQEDSSRVELNWVFNVDEIVYKTIGGSIVNNLALATQTIINNIG